MCIEKQNFTCKSTSIIISSRSIFALYFVSVIPINQHVTKKDIMIFSLFFSIAAISVPPTETLQPPMPKQNRRYSRRGAKRTGDSALQPIARNTIYTESNLLDAPPHTPDLSSNSPAATRRVTVYNNIDTIMKKYKHWTGSYEPTTFAIAINGTIIEQGQAKVINITNNQQLNALCSYDFMNGYRKGAYDITYAVQPDVTELNMTFSWKDDWRILFDHATPMKKEEIPFVQPSDMQGT